MEEQTKKCKECKSKLPLSKFTTITDKNGKNHTYSICKKCRTILDSKKRDPTKIKAFIDRSMWGLNDRDY